MPCPKGKEVSKETRKKLSRARKEFLKKNPKIAEEFGSRMKKHLKKHPEIAKRRKKRISEFWKNNPKIKKAANEKRKRTMRTAAFRKRMSQIKLQQFRENPGMAKRADRVMTAWWREHPHIKKQRSEKVKQFFISNPEKFRKFLAYGKNPAKPRYKTKQGFIVRSRGEQKIANFLHNNKIKCTYEQYTLFFPKEAQLCTPDFYLKQHKVLIEYYGGHPKSWKKKVMKNKLYKKHKIPCIFITPAELRNLNYYLIKDAERMGKSKVAKEFKMGDWDVD